jgi:hypothetical protein
MSCSTRVPRVQFGVPPNCERVIKSQDERFLTVVATKVLDETSETTHGTRVLHQTIYRVSTSPLILPPPPPRFLPFQRDNDKKRDINNERNRHK